MITIVNCHREPCDVYCGRKWKGYPDSPLGNPYPMRSEADRPVVIEKYRRWLWKQIKGRDLRVCLALLIILVFQIKHGSVKLGCWCAPKDCHCGVIIAALGSKEVGKILIEVLEAIQDWN